MFAFDLLLVLTGLSALLSAAFWVRVAASQSLRKASRLDGTERLFERANRRALSTAGWATALTIALAAFAYFVGRSAGAL